MVEALPWVLNGVSHKSRCWSLKLYSILVESWLPNNRGIVCSLISLCVCVCVCETQGLSKKSSGHWPFAGSKSDIIWGNVLKFVLFVYLHFTYSFFFSSLNLDSLLQQNEITLMGAFPFLSSDDSAMINTGHCFWNCRRQSHFLKFYLFIYFGLHWVSTAALRLSVAAVSGGCSSLQCLHSRCSGLSCFTAQAPGTQASVAAALRLSICGTDLHSATCGIFPDQGSNPCPLHWQAESHLGKFRVIFKALLGGNIDFQQGRLFQNHPLGSNVFTGPQRFIHWGEVSFAKSFLQLSISLARRRLMMVFAYGTWLPHTGTCGLHKRLFISFSTIYVYILVKKAVPDLNYICTKWGFLSLGSRVMLTQMLFKPGFEKNSSRLMTLKLFTYTPLSLNILNRWIWYIVNYLQTVYMDYYASISYK